MTFTALIVVLIALVLWPRLPNPAARIGMCIVAGLICFAALFPETTQLVVGIFHNSGEHTKNGLAYVKEVTEATDRVVYKVTGDTPAGVSSKLNVNENGGLYNPPARYENLPAGTEAITAFTRKEWARRHDVNVDGVLCIPVQLHVPGSKMGRFEIHGQSHVPRPTQQARRAWPG